MRIDRAGLRTISARVEAKLKELESELGITIKMGTGAYSADGSQGSLKVEMTPAGTSPGEADWKRYCGLFDLKPEHYGQTVTIGRDSYTMSGIKPSASRYPILATKVGDGRTFKLPAASVLKAFEMAALLARHAA